MGPDIKICGLKTAEAVERAVVRGASHIGFIFFAKSPRNIDADAAARLADPVRGQVKIVAVTVDTDDKTLGKIIARLKPDMLQLHGSESSQRLAQIKTLYGLPMIKAFQIREAGDLADISNYLGITDRFLFDARPPAGAELPGGNSVSFDWRLLACLDESINYMLSGGLNKDNAATALRETKASGLDVSSGVESAPGVKDPALIDGFFDAVRRLP